MYELLQRRPATLAGTFEGAKPVAFEDGTVTVGFPLDHTFDKRKAEAPDKREQMEEALEAVLGEKILPAYAVLDGEDFTSEAETAGAAASTTRRWWRRSRANSMLREFVHRARMAEKLHDVNALMKQAQQMQQQMEQAQEQLKDETVEASAGGGMVKVTMGGDIDPARDLNRARGDRPRGGRDPRRHGSGRGQRGAARGAGPGRVEDGRHHRRRRWAALGLPGM